MMLRLDNGTSAEDLNASYETSWSSELGMTSGGRLSHEQHLGSRTGPHMVYIMTRSDHGCNSYRLLVLPL